MLPLPRNYRNNPITARSTLPTTVSANHCHLMNPPNTTRPQAVILMGIPASGKSTFCTRRFGEERGYTRINHDTLRSWERVWSLLWKCLSTRRSFVMDNTQILRADRARIIALAAAAGYEVSGYYLQSRLAACLCRNENRSGQAAVPRSAVLNMAARLELPSYAEGFDRLYHVAWADGADYTVAPWREALPPARESDDDLALRMRKNEPPQCSSAPNAAAQLVRLDGRCFSSLTARLFEKPFDTRFRELMAQTVHHLMQCGFPIVSAYHQSDEMSLVFFDNQAFARRPAKLLTLLAGEASAAFSVALGEPAAFDCRLHNVCDGVGVRDYFRWRRMDAFRNAFNGYCYWTLRRDGLTPAETDAQLRLLSHAEKTRMLAAHGIDFAAAPAWQKYGTFYYGAELEYRGTDPRTGEPVSYSRRSIMAEDANAPRE